MRHALLGSWAGLVLAGLLLAGGASAHAQATPALQVERRGAERMELDAGQHATIVFRIANQADRQISVRPELVLPDGWRPLGTVEPAILDPGAAEIRILPFSAPSNAPAGRYTVSLQAGDGADSVTVDVLPRVALDVISLDAPSFAVAGDTYQALFRIQNRGNAASAVALDLRSGNFEAEADLADLMLAPGESREIPVQVHIGRDVTRNQRHVLRLQASTGEGEARVSASGSAGVDVLPAPGRGADHLYRLPLAATLRATPDGGVGGELAGAARLFGGRGQMDLLLRRPEPGAGVFGWGQDIYRLRLRTPAMDLRLGDHLFGVSPLTSRFRQGFGAGAEINLGWLGAEAFAEMDRRGLEEGMRTGGAIRIRPAASTEIGVQHVIDGRAGGGHVTSVRGETRLGRLLRADAEYGRSDGEAGPADAYVLNASGSAPRVSYSLRHLRGDAGFLGAYRGSEVDAGQLRIRILGPLWLQGGLTRTETTLGPADDVRETQMIRAGAQYGSLLTGEYRQEERLWTVGGDASATLLRTGALRATLNAGRLRLQPRAEVGVVTDLETSDERPYRRIGLGTSLRTTGPLSLSGSLEHVTGSTTLAGLMSDRLTGSVSAGLRTGGTSLHLSAQATRYASAETPLRGFADLRFDQDLPRGHQIGLRGRMTPMAGDAWGAEPLVSLQYTIPLSVPIGRRGDVSRVVGRLYDAETGAGVGGVLVQLGGRTAITDRNGHLTITGSDSGTQHLRVDRHTTGLDRVIDRPQPLEVEVREGRTTRVDLPLVRAGSITGQVHLMAFEGPRGRETVEEAGGVPNVLVEISRGDEVHRRVSDANGRFSFPDLRPGDWRVSVEEEALPPHHDWDEMSLALDVLPGETAEVAFRQVPRRRNVVMVGGGDLRVGAEPTEEARPAPPTPAAEPRAADPPAAPPAAEAPTIEREAEVLRRVEAGVPAGLTVTVVRSDRSLRDLAQLVYGDPDLWPRIWLANRDMVPDPESIFPGQVLRVPPAGPLTAEERAAARDIRP